MLKLILALVFQYTERRLASPVITLRATKGSALTHNELDANFTTLNAGPSGAFTIPGTLTAAAINASGDFTYTLSQNAINSIKTVNANVGAAAGVELRASNGTTSLFMVAGGTGYSGALLTGGVAGYHAVSTFGAVGLSIGTNLTAAINISSAQAVTIPNLAGAGTRAVVVDANGVLSAP